MATISRSTLLGSACALGLSAPLATVAAAAAAGRIDRDDLAALTTALGLELAAIDAYATATKLPIVSASVAAVLQRFSDDHAAHRDIIVGALTAAGQTPTQTPTPLDASTATTELDVLAAALDLERRLAKTHLDPVGTFKNRDYAASSASIMGVETCHVALLAEALRKSPAYPAGIVGA